MTEAVDMAVGGEVMSEDAERPTTPDIYCDPCLQDDERQHAEGFCVDCNEYVCQSCFKAHRKNKASKFHQLKSKAEMPTTKKSKETAEEKCIEHNRELRYYCKSHDQVLCEVCKDADHRTCTTVSKVDSLDKACSIEEKKHWLNELDYIENQFNANKMILERHNDSVEFYYEQATRSIRRIADGNKEMLRAIESTCDTVKPGIVALRKDISTHDSGRSLFLLKYRVNNQMNAFNQRLKSVTIDNKITRYWCIISDSAGKVGFVVKHPFKDNTLGVKTDTDSVTCTITAIVPLSATKLIIADQANSKLKVFDKTDSKVSLEIKVDKKPWDITVIDENTIAMTTGNDGTEIQVISLGDHTEEHKHIPREGFGFCEGVVSNNDGLIVSHYGPNELQVLDLEGQLKHTISLRNRNGPIETGDIEYLTQSHVTSHLYLSDRTCTEIRCVSLDGFMNSRFTHSKLSNPKGRFAGRDGRVFVSSYGTNTIFELNSDLSSGDVILEQKDGIIKPCGIFYDDEERKLYIGCERKNELLVFLV